MTPGRGISSFLTLVQDGTYGTDAALEARYSRRFVVTGACLGRWVHASPLPFTAWHRKGWALPLVLATTACVGAGGGGGRKRRRPGGSAHHLRIGARGFSRGLQAVRRGDGRTIQLLPKGKEGRA
jgi:hypothetical protein